MTLSKQSIISQLKDLITFLDYVQSLANAYCGSFFTENMWEKYVPVSVQSELNNLCSVNNFILLYPEIISNNCPNEFAEAHPNLLKFLNTAMNISITKNKLYFNLLKDLENLMSTLDNHKNMAKNNMSTQFMSKKKFHEVKKISEMAEFLSHLTQSSHIVDVGGGKGYLSCILALQYSFKVLGLDSSELTTCGALKRSGKVAKLWDGKITADSEAMQLTMPGSNKKVREQFVQKHYKQIVTVVNPDTDIESLIWEGFNEEVTCTTLTGLHTCGDLSSTCLKLFLTNDKVRGMVNVGCCYNRINEAFSNEDSELCLEKKSEHYGFPLSSFLTERNYKLGWNARMLASHSLDRLQSTDEFKSSQTSLFYRAVLETVIRKKNFPGGREQVGNLARKCNNFEEYMLRAFKKLGISEVLTKNDLNKLQECYIDKKPFLTAFFLLRISLAPIVESIILLDRILYLIENGTNNAYLVPLFDLKVSPRGFGIIAWKDLEKS